MAMFRKNIRFIGKHAEILQKYSKDKGAETNVSFMISNQSGEVKNIYIFETRLYCYMVAGMLGIINNKSVEEDRENKNMSATIFAEILNNNQQNLERLYHHMVLSENNELSVDGKIKKAFSIVPDDKCDEEQHKLENYVRGGLEIIDEVFKDCKTYEDICNAFYSFKEMLDLNEK